MDGALIAAIVSGYNIVIFDSGTGNVLTYRAYSGNTNAHSLFKKTIIISSTPHIAYLASRF